MNFIFDKIKPWFKPIILSGIFMCVPYRIAFRSLNETDFLVIKSLFWLYDQRIPFSPLMAFPSWEVFLAACILTIPPIWFSGMTSVRNEPRYKSALITCIIDWIAYVILIPEYLFEYNLLDDAPDTWLNLTFFVTLLLVGIVIIPTFLDHGMELNQTITKNQMMVLVLISLVFPISLIVPIGDTFYSVRIESISWLFFKQSIMTDSSSYYYFLSDIILSIKPAPTFPIGVMGWILNFLFIYQVAQYDRGFSKLRPVLLLGLSTLIPTLLNNVFMTAMGYQPSSIIHIPIPSLIIVGIYIVRRLQPPLKSSAPTEETEVAVPLLHRIRSRLWGRDT